MYPVLISLPDYYLISFQRRMVSEELARAGNSCNESLRNHYLKHFLIFPYFTQFLLYKHTRE